MLYKPVNRFLEQRKEYFDSAEQKNNQTLEEAERLKSEYEHKLETVEKEITEQRKEAEKTAASVSSKYIEDAKAKAAAIITAAEQEAEERKEHILESAQTEIGELVLAATQKLLSDTVTPERNSALYDEFIRSADQIVAETRAKNGRK